MAKERTSKLQRWILKQAAEDDIYKHQILDDYFHLKRSRYKSGTMNYGVYFSTGSPPSWINEEIDWKQRLANNHARVTTHNCLKNMEAKGLIVWIKTDEHNNMDTIMLTKKGLNLNVTFISKDKET